MGAVYDHFGMPSEVAFTVMAAALVCLVYLVYRDMFVKTDIQTDKAQPFCINVVRYSVIVLFLFASIILWLVKAK